MSDDTNTTQNDDGPEAPKTPERPQRPARRADGDEAVVRPVIRMLGKATGRGGGRRKVCRFCAEPNTAIDYKNPQILKNFITDRGKITPRRISGNCAKHQRRLELAIRRARMIALMPFTVTGR